MLEVRSIKPVPGRGMSGILALIAFTAWSAGAFGQVASRYELADLKALEAAFTRLAEEVAPSVVAIRTYYVRNPHGTADARVAIPVSQGSGFVIDPDGFVATNRHVLENANSITVVLHNSERYDATIQQGDPRSDLAVLKIDAHGLEPVRWGALSKIKVNQWTFACGNPFGLANDDGNSSITFGAVSALGRDMTQKLASDPLIQYYGNLIETSSAINPGNSGGPLFNLDGEVIGVVTAIATSSGVSEGHGYAIPIDDNIRRILDTLKAGEAASYGFMGISVGDVDLPRSRRVAHDLSSRGARIDDVDPPDGPAGKAGLKKGDVIIAVDGVPVENRDHLVRLIGFSPVGAGVEVTYLRRGVKRTTTVTLGDRHEILGVSDTQ